MRVRPNVRALLTAAVLITVTLVLQAEALKPEEPKSGYGTVSDSANHTPLASASAAVSMPQSVPVSAQDMKALADPSGSVLNQQLASALIKTAGAAGQIAKSVTETIGDYVKQKQALERQQELADRFYENLNLALRPFSLNLQERGEITRRMERIYIEDGTSEKPRLDTLSFRDLPNLVKMAYAEMVFKRTREGTAETYYPNGEVKTRWHLKEGKPDGTATTFYEDGEIRFMDDYVKGEKIRRRKFDHEGKLEFDQPYVSQTGKQEADPTAPKTEGGAVKSEAR